jgi:predicted GNAT superfamily acetyltransferase
MEDELNRGLPSDRFEAEWWLRREKSPPSGTNAQVLLRPGPDQEPVSAPATISGREAVLIEVPSDFQAIKRKSLELALSWRMASREAFENALRAGLIAVGFKREGAYLMAPPE